MWSTTFQKAYSGVTVEQVWVVWTDVNNWHVWQDDIEYARLAGEFSAGTVIAFRPKGGPEISIATTEVSPRQSFVDMTSFPLAKMRDSHVLNARPEGVEIVSMLSVEGPLSFVWVKLVAEGIAKSMEQQTEALVRRAHELAR